MSAQFTRQTHPTSYIAYTKEPSKKPVPVVVDGKNEPMQVYSEVFVREYPTIKITKVDEPRTDNQRVPSLYVKFDAASAKNADGESLRLREDFGGSITAGGDMETIVRRAYEEGVEVYVAFETKRKWKRRGTDEVISYLTPIQELRGAAGEGKGNANATRDNCSNVIVAIGPTSDQSSTVLSAEAVTDPFNWGAFRSNHEGTLVPTGFVRVGSPEGNSSGAIVPRTDAPASGGSVDTTEIAEKVAALLQGGGEAGRPAQRAARSVEGKPWEPYNSDGSVNAGSYLATRSRDTWSGVMTLIENGSYAEQDAAQAEGREPRMLDQDALIPSAASLTKVLLWATDRVQEAVAGHTNRADRSHQEAGKWVHQAATHVAPLNVAWIVDDDKSAVKVWAKQIVDAATRLYATTMDDVQSYLDGPAGEQASPTTDASTNAHGTVAAADRKTTSPTQPQKSASSGPEAAVPVSAADDPELAERWAQLLATAKLAEHVDHVSPLLVKAFNTDDLSSITAERFGVVLAVWEQNPERFFEAARSAYESASPAA
ncbi:MAG: hypothetical protein L0H59_12015 [Tomitella sp.]|nr:hypothetical protein [Tomitella sp.]